MDELYTQQYERFELKHWWFVARRAIILDQIQRQVKPDRKQGAWLDVGCGTGVLLGALDGFKSKCGLEQHPGCVEIARGKGLQVFAAGADGDLSALGTFRLITLCDVMEHLEDDRKVVRAVRAALEQEGIALVTVPALQGLWSQHDEVNRHYRRYTKRMLCALFPEEDWSLLKVSYFSSLLLPAIGLARKWSNWRGGKSQTGDLKFGPRFIDAALYGIFILEKYFLRLGAFPLGSSLILVARKKACPS